MLVENSGEPSVVTKASASTPGREGKFPKGKKVAKKKKERDEVAPFGDRTLVIPGREVECGRREREGGGD